MNSLLKFTQKYHLLIISGCSIIIVGLIIHTGFFSSHPIGPEDASHEDQTFLIKQDNEFTGISKSQIKQTYRIGSLLFQFIHQSTPHSPLYDTSGNILTISTTLFAGIKVSVDEGKNWTNFFTIKNKRNKETGEPIFYNPLAVFKSQNMIFVDIGDEQGTNPGEGNILRFFYDLENKERKLKSCFTYVKTSKTVLNKGIYLPYLLSDSSGCSY